MKVLLAVPCYGGVITSPCVISIINTIRTIKGVEFDLFTLPSESLISRGRNKCAEYALKHGYDKLFFIDADLAFSPEDIALILKSDKLIIGGTYPMKCFPVTLNFNPLPEHCDIFGRHRGQDNYFEFIKKYVGESGEIEVRHVPTGFLCIDTRVLSDLARRKCVEQYGTFHHTTGEDVIYYDFFPVRVREGSYESEDWAFCSIAREAGFKVYLQTKVVCGHVGTHIYGLGQWAAIGQKPLIPSGGQR